MIEIMVVVVIIGILGALIIPNVVGRDDQARATAVKNDLRAVANALEMYKLDNFHYPSTDQGLQALVTQTERISRGEELQPERLSEEGSDRSVGYTDRLHQYGDGIRVVLARRGRRRRRRRARPPTFTTNCSDPRRTTASGEL